MGAPDTSRAEAQARFIAAYKLASAEQRKAAGLPADGDAVHAAQVCVAGFKADAHAREFDRVAKQLASKPAAKREKQPKLAPWLPRAQDLAEKGYHLVVLNMQGTPAQGGYLQRETPPDEATLRSWAIQFPVSKLGIVRAGTRLNGVDLDLKNGKDGPAAFARCGKIPTGTPSQRTKSGGAHYFTRSEEPSIYCPAFTKDGVDFPQYFADYGAKLPPLDELPPTPEWWESMSRTSRNGTKVDLSRFDFEARCQDKAKAALRTYLSTIGTPELGERHNALISAVKKAGDFGLHPDGVPEVLAELWADVWHGAEWEEEMGKIAGMYAQRVNPIGSEHPDTIASDFEPVEPAEPSAASDEAGADPLADEDAGVRFWAGELNLDAPPEPIPYVLKGFMNQGSRSMIFGESGKGKTFCALDLAAHVAAGASHWGPYRVMAGGGGVLYYGFEGQNALDLRVRAWFKLYPHHRRPDLPLMVAAAAGRMVNRGGALAPGQADMRRRLAEFRKRTGHAPVLIIIDPLRDALGGSDSEVDLTQEFLDYTRRLARDTGAHVCFIHHTGWAETSRARGDSGLHGSVDHVIQIVADGAGGKIVSRKQRDAEELSTRWRRHPMQFGVDRDGDLVKSLAVEHLADIADAHEFSGDLTDKEQVVYEAARQAMKATSSDEVKRATIVDRLAGEGWSAKEVDNVLPKLVSKGALGKVRRGTYQVVDRGAGAMTNDQHTTEVGDWEALA